MNSMMINAFIEAGIPFFPSSLSTASSRIPDVLNNSMLLLLPVMTHEPFVQIL